jgi:hypothetical protein
LFFKRKDKPSEITLRGESNSFEEAHELLQANIRYWKSTYEVAGSRVTILHSEETKNQVNAVTCVCECKLLYKVESIV